MKVLHIVSNLSPESGGPTKVVLDLSEALVQKDVEISVFASVKKGDEQNIANQPKVKLQLFQQNFPSRWWPFYSSSFANAVWRKVYKFDLIHIHEIWHYPHYVACRAAKKAKKPYIVTIHGALDPWCLNYKALKKKIYAASIQKRILNEATAIHALTKEEMRHIQAFGVNNFITVIPNGLNPKEFQNLPSKKAIEEFYPDLNGKKVILFLSRIHPKKGLDLLAKAFGRVARVRNDVRLLLAGPDNEGYKVQVEKILKIEGVLDKVIFTGMLTGQKKLVALRGADLFVLPSYSEGFSMAILEAMICSLPVIVTRQCNFPDIAEVGAGEIINPDVDQLSEALIKLLSCHPSVRYEMGRKGRDFILKNFTWDKIASQIVRLYEDVLWKYPMSK